MTTIRGTSSAAATRPIAPMPIKKEAGYLTAIYSGTNPKITAKSLTVDMKFASKATAGGDLASFMKVTVPVPMGIRNEPQKFVSIQVPFKNGDSAETQAKKLEAALKKQAPSGYVVARQGTAVRLTMRLMA